VGLSVTSIPGSIGARSSISTKAFLGVLVAYFRSTHSPAGPNQVVILRDAIAYLESIPAREHKLPPVQAAALVVIQAAENGGSIMMARMGVMQAIHRHEKPDFRPRKKSAKKYTILR
jgi:hypothetical protein